MTQPNIFKSVKKWLSLSTLALVASGALTGCQAPASNRMLPVFSPQSGPVNMFSLGSARRPKLGLRLAADRRRVRLAPEDLMPNLIKPGQALPSKVDLRQWASPIDNQGELGSCTGFSIKAARELMLIRDGKMAFAPLSPLFLYYNERKREGTIDEDAGAMIDTGMELIKDIGISREALWSYDDSNDNNPVTKEKFQVVPSAEAYNDARKYRVQDVQALETLRDIRYELAHRNPVVIGIEVYEALFNTKDGKLPQPNPKEESLGGHAVVVVGYDDIQKALIVKNSWGNDWGDKGYFYLPYNYVKLGLASEAWTAH
jgi:C1A family cysteine protease